MRQTRKSYAMNLGSLDVVRKALLESWGFSVVPFTAAQPQGEYDLAVSKGDVVYLSSTVNFADVTSKLKAQPVGVVNEVSALTAYLGFTSGSSVTSGTQTAIVDNTHEITSVFGTGNLSITSSTQSLHRFVNTMGPGFQKLTTTTFSIDPMLMTLVTGDELLWGGVAPARRVMLPWGGSTFNVSELTSNGQTILMRSLKWAAPCDSGGSLLFVVNNAASLTAQDTAKKALMEGWGWIVKPISAAATQAAFDAAVLSANVAYVSDGINASDLGTKLKAKTIGVVNEHPSLHSVFGFSTVRASSTGNPRLTNEPGCTNSAAFVNDVTIPDNTVINAGETFTKTWRVSNTGTCTWAWDYTLAYYLPRTSHGGGGLCAARYYIRGSDR